MWKGLHSMFCKTELCFVTIVNLVLSFQFENSETDSCYADRIVLNLVYKCSCIRLASQPTCIHKSVRHPR